MPELPEVETIRRDLERLAVGSEIVSVEVGWPGSIKNAGAGFETRLQGARLTGFKRRAKMLLVELDSGDRLLVHLKMSGRFVLVPAAVPADKHTRLTLVLKGGNELRFNDQRKFGYVKLIETGDPRGISEFEHLGPEPLVHDFTLSAWLDLLATKSGSRRSMKATLLDQSFISGLGNIYVDETLHAAGVLPDRTVSSIKRDEAERIYHAMRAVLTAAIESRGTTFSSYVDAEGRRGDFLRRLKVYGREGEPCLTCGTVIEKNRVAGRGTHYCVQCQH
jgi:formamidopyrimidine-DNA glycosylase